MVIKHVFLFPLIVSVSVLLFVSLSLSPLSFSLLFLVSQGEVNSAVLVYPLPFLFTYTEKQQCFSIISRHRYHTSIPSYLPPNALLTFYRVHMFVYLSGEFFFTNRCCASCLFLPCPSDDISSDLCLLHLNDASHYKVNSE